MYRQIEVHANETYKYVVKMSAMQEFSLCKTKTRVRYLYKPSYHAHDRRLISCAGVHCHAR